MPSHAPLHFFNVQAVFDGYELITRDASSAPNVGEMAGSLGGITQEGTRGEVVHKHESSPSKSWLTSYHPTCHLGPWEISWKSQTHRMPCVGRDL